MSWRRQWEINVLIATLCVVLCSITAYCIRRLLAWRQEVKGAKRRTRIAMTRSEPEIRIRRCPDTMSPSPLEAETYSWPTRYSHPLPPVEDKKVTSHFDDSKSSKYSFGSISPLTSDATTLRLPVDMQAKRATLRASETTKSILSRRGSWPLQSSAPYTRTVKCHPSKETNGAIGWPFLGYVGGSSYSFPDASSSDESESTEQPIRNDARVHLRQNQQLVRFTGISPAPDPEHLCPSTGTMVPSIAHHMSS